MLSRVIGEKERIVTSMTFLWTQINSCTQIITDGMSGHDPEWIGWLRLVYAETEAFSYFPLGLLYRGHKINLTLCDQYKNSETHVL